jgi:DNA-binding response OmpR family regulator
MNRRNRSTILIIEDDEAVRQTLVDMLALNGFQTATASDGTAGFAAAKSQTPALIITDIEMPGMTGFELLEQFGRDELLRTIPVIVISAKIDRAATRRGMELGASDFITKPFTEDEVIHSITTRLEKKELLDELDAFAHTVAHDLKNPLATLCGRIDLLGMMLGKSDEATLRNHLTSSTNSSPSRASADRPLCHDSST